MSKFTSWFTPFLTKTAKFEPVNAGMRAVGLNKLADSRQHFETVAAPRATNQFVGAISKPVTGLEKHYGPYHGDSGTAKTRDDASNHGGDIGAIVAALYFGGSAVGGAAGGGAGAGAGAVGAEAGATGAAGAAGGVGTAAGLSSAEALAGTAEGAAAAGSTGAAAAGGATGAAAGSTAGTAATAEGATAGAEGAAGSGAAGSQAAATSEAADAASAGPEASAPQAASQAPAQTMQQPAAQAPQGEQPMAQGDMDSFESNTPDTSSPYSQDQGGMEQYESDSGNEPNGQGSDWRAQAKKYGKLMNQTGKAMQKEKPSIQSSNVNTSTGVLDNPYVTSSRTKKTGPTASMRDLVSEQNAQRDPIDANGMEMASIHALSKQINAAKQRLAALSGKNGASK